MLISWAGLQSRENFENTREINPKLPSGPIYMNKLLDSDWPVESSAVQG